MLTGRGEVAGFPECSQTVHERSTDLGHQRRKRVERCTLSEFRFQAALVQLLCGVYQSVDEDGMSRLHGCGRCIRSGHMAQEGVSPLGGEFANGAPLVDLLANVA